MFRKKFEENKCIYISKYIYENYDKFLQDSNINSYIIKSKNIINKYKKIWPYMNEKQIISNLLALNLSFLYNLI